MIFDKRKTFKIIFNYNYILHILQCTLVQLAMKIFVFDLNGIRSIDVPRIIIAVYHLQEQITFLAIDVFR